MRRNVSLFVLHRVYLRFAAKESVSIFTLPQSRARRLREVSQMARYRASRA